MQELQQLLQAWRQAIGAPVPADLNMDYIPEYDMQLRRRAIKARLSL